MVRVGTSQTILPALGDLRKESENNRARMKSLRCFESAKWATGASKNNRKSRDTTKNKWRRMSRRLVGEQEDRKLVQLRDSCELLPMSEPNLRVHNFSICLCRAIQLRSSNVNKNANCEREKSEEKEIESAAEELGLLVQIDARATSLPKHETRISST